MPQFFIDRPVFAWVLAILITLGGGLALTQLPAEAYPEIAPPQVAVTTTYPGASVAWSFTKAVSIPENIISFGKARLAYGESGQQQIVTHTVDDARNPLRTQMDFCHQLFGKHFLIRHSDARQS